MRTLDGGDGGGQLVRTAVAMSAVTDTPIAMENVRGGRETPGLRPQHVAAIETVAALADADTGGVEIGAEEFTFEPGAISGVEVEREVGTAGSVTLVFDAILPLVLRLDDPATVTVGGGTDVKWSPPFDYFRQVKLPMLHSAGLEAATKLHRRGFYPSGGGRATLSLRPSTLDSLSLVDRGPLRSLAVHSVASTSLESADVAVRQADAAVEVLEAQTDVPVESAASYADTLDKGSAIVIVARYESSVTGFSALGEPGKPAEAVAQSATDGFETFAETNAAADVHLADQVVPLLALAGGRVRIPRVTDHVETHLDLVGEFGLPVAAERGTSDTVMLVADGAENQGTVP